MRLVHHLLKRCEIWGDVEWNDDCEILCEVLSRLQMGTKRWLR